MSPWRAAAVVTMTGREAASPPAFASEVAALRRHNTTMTTITTATISQIHQRLLGAVEFSVG